MTRREQCSQGGCGPWESLLAAREEDWLDLLAAEPDAPEDWRALARRGGFPIPAVKLRRAGERELRADVPGA